MNYQEVWYLINDYPGIARTPKRAITSTNHVELRTIRKQFKLPFF